jgi:hypothetical protein
VKVELRWSSDRRGQTGLARLSGVRCPCLTNRRKLSSIVRATCVDSTCSVFAEEYQSSAKIILLTEGKSDTAILSAALDLLYPHLAGYYSFMEFDALRVGGGAGNLANLVKAFAGAGIANRTIALFDRGLICGLARRYSDSE